MVHLWLLYTKPATTKEKMDWLLDQVILENTQLILFIYCYMEERKEGIILFNAALSWHYLWFCVMGYRYVVLDMWLMNPCHYLMDYSFWIAARDLLLYTLSQLFSGTYHSLCYTICGTLTAVRNRQMNSPRKVNLLTFHIMSPFFKGS